MEQILLTVTPRLILLQKIGADAIRTRWHGANKKGTTKNFLGKTGELHRSECVFQAKHQQTNNKAMEESLGGRTKHFDRLCVVSCCANQTSNAILFYISIYNSRWKNKTKTKRENWTLDGCLNGRIRLGHIVSGQITFCPFNREKKTRKQLFNWPIKCIFEQLKFCNLKMGGKEESFPQGQTFWTTATQLFCYSLGNRER